MSFKDVSMAGNKVNSKTKGKEDKNKTNKNTCQNSEDTEDLDYTLLRKPIPTSVTGFAQARKVFDLATEELKELLSNECDLLYECKVCRNLFRSLANFISHKRVYCKEKFNYTVHSHFINTNSKYNELQKIKKFEDNYQEFLKENRKINNDNNEENDDRIPLTKDLTSIIEKIVSSKGVQGDHLKQQDVVLQSIPKTSVAVYQSIKYDGNDDNMSTQVKELDTILSRENAVMQSDGRFKTENNSHVETENVIQISDDEESDCMGNLKCKLCDQQFSTQKTLKSHIKTKHLESRLVYPCPDCLEIFSTSWSVYRHLFKVHRKTAAQIRRLRETIQSKAFRMNNPPASYEKRKANAKNVTAQKITEEERIDQENQAWMDNMEGDGELPRCGGCGRTFERRAALAAHTNTCQPRSRALARRPPETKKIEIQIRKDYNKGPAASAPAKPQDKNEDAPSPSKPQAQKDDGESRNDSTLTEAVMSIVGVTGTEETNEILEEPVEVPKLDIEAIKPMQKLPYSHQAEKSNFNALKQRILQDIELEQLSCKKCDNKYTQIYELYDHVASHYKWMRYACKLCNFKHYEYEKVPEHVKIVHKLKGDSEFYFSTVKAIDGVEASELSDLKEEGNDPNETSPNSRRPSRCSSDSSRFSDDSCSSTSTRIEVGSRKRKMNPYRNASKKKKEAFNDEGDGDSKDGEVSPQKDPLHIENDSSSSSKVFEENSSDMDESEEKSVKRLRIDYLSSVASRRPVRKRTKPKNEDFEYDLSNLLKMEAQGYRDSQVNAIKPAVTKKKIQQDYQNNYNNINKECSGALSSLSRQSVEGNKAHMKTNNLAIFNTTKEQRISNIFVRPMLPKIARVDKISPVKEPSSDTEKEITITNSNTLESNETAVVKKNILSEQTQPKQNELNVISVQKINDKAMTSEIVIKETASEAVKKESSKPMSDLKDGPSNAQTPESTPQEKTKSNLNIVPIKLNKQGLDLIKNPLIKKNMTDFSKAGMKTKILVIKPINRKDGVQSINNPLKFQTIKLKDPNVNIKNEEKPSDQVVVVKVPKVDCVLPRPPVISNNNTLPDPATRTVESKEVGNCDIKCKEREEEKESETISENTNVETCSNKNLLPVTDTNEVAVTR